MENSNSSPGQPGSRAAGGTILPEAFARRDVLGTREFYVSPAALTGLLGHALGEIPRPVLSLNRPHADGRTMIHRVEWSGMVFICVSPRPLMVG